MQISAKFESSALDIQAEGQTHTHHLCLAKLYSKVIPEKCTARVVKDGRQIRVSLRKVSTQEWKYLRLCS